MTPRSPNTKQLILARIYLHRPGKALMNKDGGALLAKTSLISQNRQITC